MKNGWERAEYFCPGEPPRPPARTNERFGWTRPPFHDRVAVEHRRSAIGGDRRHDVVREARDRRPRRARACLRSRIDRPVGSVVYTQLVDERGHIVGDVTVTRLAADRFRVVTGAGAVDSDRGFLELNGASDRGRHGDLRGDRDLGPRRARGARVGNRADVSSARSGFAPRKSSSGLAQRITYCSRSASGSMRPAARCRSVGRARRQSRRSRWDTWRSTR